MDVGHHGEIEFLANSLQYLQGFFVADARKGIQPGAVRLAVGAFENPGNVKLLADVFQGLGDEEGRGLVLDDAGASQKEKAVRAEGLQEVVFCGVHGGNFLQRSRFCWLINCLGVELFALALFCS